MEKSVYRKSQQPNVESKNSFHDSIILLFCYSITQIINQSINRKSRLRNPSTQTPYTPGTESDLFLGRGYTGHEHLPWFGLINMNARLYDPAVGRFLSPDPILQAPTNSQNFNRYSYALNNPLKYTDPTGMSYWYTGPNGSFMWSRTYLGNNPSSGYGFNWSYDTGKNNDPNFYIGSNGFGVNFGGYESGFDRPDWGYNGGCGGRGSGSYRGGGVKGSSGSLNNLAYDTMMRNLNNPSGWYSGTMRYLNAVLSSESFHRADGSIFRGIGNFIKVLANSNNIIAFIDYYLGLENKWRSEAMQRQIDFRVNRGHIKFDPFSGGRGLDGFNYMGGKNLLIEGSDKVSFYGISDLHWRDLPSYLHDTDYFYQKEYEASGAIPYLLGFNNYRADLNLAFRQVYLSLKYSSAPAFYWGAGMTGIFAYKFPYSFWRLIF